MSRRVRYVLPLALVLVLAAAWYAWAWIQTRTLEGELVDSDGNPVPPEHGGFLRVVALIVVLVVVIPAVRTGVATLRRRR